jgi:DNA-binding XRE family transcriptional regulator
MELEVVEMATLSSRIFDLRKEFGLTQGDLGDIVGVVKSTISLYEHGRSVPNDQIKTAMCRYFNVSMDYLLGLTDNRGQKPETTPQSDSPDPAFLEAMECLEGLSGDALQSALRCLQAIKFLDDLKGGGPDNTIILEKHA